MRRVLLIVLLAAGLPGCASNRPDRTVEATGKTAASQPQEETLARLIRQYPGNNPLALAILRNDDQLALFIIAQHPRYVFQDGGFGASPLYMALEKEKLPVMRALLKAGAARTPGTPSPFMCAVNHASDAATRQSEKESLYLLMVREMLAAGADVTACEPEGISPLFAARSARLAALLIAHGADVNAGPPSTGVTPLMLAAIDGDRLRAKLLLDHGADPGRRDDLGHTALYYAHQEGNPEVAALIAGYQFRTPPPPAHGK